MQQKERHSYSAHCLLLAAGGVCLALLAVYLAYSRFDARRHAPPDSATTATQPPHVVSSRFSRTVVEGFRLDGSPDAAPFPVIALGACRVTRPRLGGFRLGIGEVLELDRLELNLPLDIPAAGTNAAQTINALLSHSLDVSSFRRMAHVVAPVSSATITGLRISLVHGTNQVVVLTASSGRIAGRSDLTLRKCVFLDSNLRSCEAAKARLTNDHGWRLAAENGPTVEMEAVAEAIRRREPVTSNP